MKIICIGRNYLDHVREMGNEVPRYPVFFMKSSNALLPEGKDFNLPDFSHEIHYEGELVIRLGKRGKNISLTEAEKNIDAITAGIDFTARDLQRQCIELGEPWEIAKSFDHSAAIGSFIPYTPQPYHFVLYKNEKMVQQSSSAQLIFSFSELISYVSTYITLEAGDVIFTGTPAGVGLVQSGDILKGYVNDMLLLTVRVK